MRNAICVLGMLRGGDQIIEYPTAKGVEKINYAGPSNWKAG
jgi:hypothetical protein